MQLVLYFQIFYHPKYFLEFYQVGHSDIFFV